MIPTSIPGGGRQCRRRRFNLVIEKLMIPTKAIRDGLGYAYLMFQSRNRETYDSNEVS